jgi:periplasmic divalent cation tolerance protein
MADWYQVVTTTDSADEANRLADAIVTERLGACVHVIGPITSVYRWNGAITRDQEWRLAIKTATDRLAELIDYVETHHSYDVPMVVATAIVTGSPDYLAWLTTETRPH